MKGNFAAKKEETRKQIAIRSPDRANTLYGTLNCLENYCIWTSNLSELETTEFRPAKIRLIPNGVAQFIHDVKVERDFSGYFLQSFPRGFDVWTTLRDFLSLQMVDNHSRQAVKNILIIFMQMLPGEKKELYSRRVDDTHCKIRLLEKQLKKPSELLVKIEYSRYS